MGSGYYAACAGLIARTDALEVSANNLANVNTTGYKAQKEYFSSLVSDAAANQNPLNHAMNDYGVLGGARVDVAAGNLEHTAGDLDLAVEGGAFFRVQTAGGTRYTRDGNFTLSANRQLQTQSGNAVLSEEGQPMTLPTGAIAVSTDGTISVDNNIVAKVGLSDLKGLKMIPEGANNFSVEGTPGPATDSSVRQGMLESSNLSGVAASVGLIILQRHSALLERALTIFHTEFNKSAADDLPRV